MKSNVYETPADFCRRMGWEVGTRLIGEPDARVEITGIGHRLVLAWWRDPAGGHEGIMDFSWRDWQQDKAA